MAVIGNRVRIVELFANKLSSEQINVQNKKRKTALEIAIEKKTVGIALILINKLEAKQLTCTLGMENKNNYLSLSIQQKQDRIALELISRLVTLNTQELIYPCVKDNNLLKLMIKENQLTIFTVLLEVIWKKILYRRFLLSFAVECKNVFIADFLIKKLNDGSLWEYAVRNNNIDIIIILFESNKIQINAANENGHTLLHLAVLHRNKELITLLIKFNPEFTLKNAFYRSPLDLLYLGKTFQQPEEEILQILKSAQAQVEQKLMTAANDKNAENQLRSSIMPGIKLDLEELPKAKKKKKKKITQAVYIEDIVPPEAQPEIKKFGKTTKVEEIKPHSEKNLSEEPKEIKLMHVLREKTQRYTPMLFSLPETKNEEKIIKSPNDDVPKHLVKILRLRGYYPMSKNESMHSQVFVRIQPDLMDDLNPKEQKKFQALLENVPKYLRNNNTENRSGIESLIGGTKSHRTSGEKNLYQYILRLNGIDTRLLSPGIFQEEILPDFKIQVMEFTQKTNHVNLNWYGNLKKLSQTKGLNQISGDDILSLRGN